jgi:hypothetical protein
MADAKIKVMISSRCNDKFPKRKGQPLSTVRKIARDEIKAITLFGKEVFEVWINEDEGPKSGDKSAQKACLEEVEKCDIFVALYNGNAGYRQESESIGICHQELEKVWSQAPGKMYILNIFTKNKKVDGVEANKRFQEYVERLNRFEKRNIADAGELVQAIKETVVKATIELAKRGVKETSRGSYYVGASLDWTRINYTERAQEMSRVTVDALATNSKDADHDKNSKDADYDKKIVRMNICGQTLLVKVGAIPDAVAVAAAREMVGQPQLKDHDLHDELKNCEGGPVHFIACHKNVTESQARTMLGFPDATVVTGPFGIYVADSVQKIQLVLLSNCRNETNTRNQVGNFLNWLGEAEQDRVLVEIAVKRKAVVDVLVD